MTNPAFHSSRWASRSCESTNLPSSPTRTQAAASSKGPQARYQRYSPILQFLAQHRHFTLQTVQASFDAERPAFVTRVINELVAQGWLIQETKAQFRWNQHRGAFCQAKWLDEKIYGNRVSATPQRDRPRERLLSEGAERLGTAELLAILIRSGRPGESAVTAGQKLAQAYADRLEALPSAGRGELKSISCAVEKTAYCQIMAGIELGRRIAEQSSARVITKIGGRHDAIAYCRRRFSRLASDASQEEFHIVTLDTKNQVIDTHQITVGTLDASLVHPREVFRAALRDAAASILLVHNHPSGDPTPSVQDRHVTTRLKESGRLLGIDVLDHIVLGRDSATSTEADL